LNNNDLSIVLCGEAGQGIQTVEHLLGRLLPLSGYYIFSTSEFMSRIRGGFNSSEVRVASTPVSAYLERIDLLFPFFKGAIQHLQKRIAPDTIILGESINIDPKEIDGHRIIDIPFSKLASEVGGTLYLNIIASGVICGLLQADLDAINHYLTKFFAEKGQEIITKNLEAMKIGYELGVNLLNSGKIQTNIPKNSKVKDNFIISGTESIGLGVIAGGCNFISSYPMSPSTGLLVFLSQQSNAFDIIAEQAEDEISAINMALGAWYAGARGMVTTSGGGFALMVEGLSLAGVTESPIVIHLAQRPGPGTGLPTRTEQADLLFALHAGHGEFPRIILAPGSAEQGFSLAQKAFNLADKYQVPVFLLTDQYFLDSNYSFSSLDLSAIKVEKQFIRTTPAYKRYQLTASGLSPRGIPGYGEGLVTLDSDEHEEDGRITENHDVRIQMVNKRLKKLELLKQDIIPPELIGPENYKNLIICWGSTYHAVREALNTLKRDDLAVLHFKQVYPVHPLTADYLKKADKTIILEGNATAQFKQLIKLQTSIEIDDQILKYNGQPFSVEEIIKKLKELLS